MEPFPLQRAVSVATSHCRNGAQAAPTASRLSRRRPRHRPSYLRRAGKEARSTSYVSIFEKVGGEVDDAYRAQARVSRLSPAMAAIKHALVDVTQCLDPAWRPYKFSYLRSLAGGAEQQAHHDYSAEDIARVQDQRPGGMLGGVLIALQEETRLRVYDGCVEAVDTTKERQLVIPRGYCVIFRGDLFHGGCAYSKDNYRLHCYLAYAGIQWSSDFVAADNSHEDTCQYCDNFTGSKDKVRAHRFYCAKYPKGPDNIKKRKAENKKGQLGDYKCNICQAAYDNPASLRSHISRGKHKMM